MKTYLTEQEPKRQRTAAASNQTPVAQGKGLPARPVQFAAAPGQRKKKVVQREEKDDEKKKKDQPSDFTHELEFLPPALKLNTGS